MFRAGIIKGVAMAAWVLLAGVGCATVRPVKQTPPIASVHNHNPGQPDVVDNFRHWLGRDVGWSQDQRLRRIERDWMSTLSQLPSFERREAAAAIEANIRLRRLHHRRERIVRRLLDEHREVVADATPVRVVSAP